MLVVTDDGAWTVRTPRLPMEVSGSGDLTSALFTAHLKETGSAADALAATASSVYAVLAATLDSGERELRIVAAQDEERRRLERNLHDGAQQQLVALQVRLSLAERQAEDDCRVRDSLGALKQEAGEALERSEPSRASWPPG